MRIQPVCLTRGSVWRLTLFSMIGIYRILTIISATMVCSNEEISQRGMALLNHTYKSLYTEDYPSCLKTCTFDPDCMSLNYWWNCSQCDLNSKTKYSAESKAFSRESPSTYMGSMREPETTRTFYRSCRHVHPSNGNGEYTIIDPTLSGKPSTAYCDMTTDGGGWTAIQMVSLTESNLHLQDEALDFKGLFIYNDHRQTVSSTIMQLLKHKMGFKQIRFYCHKKKVGTVFHVMTNINSLGESAVEFFVNSQIATRPQACGSYTVLPDDNSKLSKDCRELGWSGTTKNGNHVDGKLSLRWVSRNHHLWQTPFARMYYNRFKSSPWERDCDDWNSKRNSLSPGDTWAVFVR